MAKLTMSMRMAKRATEAILDIGLASSTWRDTYPEAYQDLLEYRQDMQLHIEREIKLVRNAAIKEVKG